MVSLVLTGHDLEASLEAGRAVRVVLCDAHEVYAEFELDRSELRAVLNGRMAYQGIDGKGRAIGIESSPDGLRVRIENVERGTKICQIARDQAEELLLPERVRV